MAEVSEKTTTVAAESVKTSTRKAAPGLTFHRYFTQAGVSPYDALEWERRLAQITDAHGKEAATAWLLELYAQSDDAGKAALVPLVLAVPEPDDALYEIIEVEEDKAIERLEGGG